MRSLILRSLAIFALILTGVQGPAGAQATATLSGHVTDAQGAPLAGVTITMRGPSTYTATTDAAGAFSVSSVTPGLYSVTATKAGYNSATDVIALTAGQSQSVTIALQQISFTRLLTIARVSTTGAGTFNTSPAAVNVVNAQAFQNQAAPQVRDVLNEIPGLQISLPGGSTNGASPGSITVPTIRAAASYETASLIDGHPLAVEDYGDFVTTFLSSYMFSDVEVIKGPGATAPEVNGAINGTVDFHTKDPTLTFTPDFQLGVTNIGGTIADFGVSDTIGKIGFVAAFSNVDNPSVLNGKRILIDPSGFSLSSGALITDACGNTNFSPPCYTNVAKSESNIQTGFTTLACCYTEQGYLNDTSELLKVRYNFSPATHVTAAYLGVQAFADQTANVGNATVNSVFVPSVAGPGYTGPLTPGPQPVVFVFPGNSETDNEPMFEGEIGTTVGNDSVIARYYHTDIYRLVTAGQQNPVTGLQNFSALTPFTMNLYGVDAFGPVYNGPLTTVYTANFFQEIEQDKLTGWSAEWDHPFGVGDSVSLAVNQTNTNALDYELDPKFSSISLPQGSNQIYTTGQIRGEFFLTPKVELTVADYANVYRSQYPASCPFAFGFSACDINGDNATFKTQTTSHNDPRAALEFRPSPNLAVRLSAGSAIAPPFLNLLGLISPGVATYSTSTGIATITRNNPNLKAETAFGYDAGADYRLPDGQTIVSADVYLNNLFNHYFGETVYSGTICGSPIPCVGPHGSPVPTGTRVYYTTNSNISNFRFEGVELSVNRHPLVGLGFTVAGGLQRGYVYNLPAGFYCSSPTPACISNPALWDQNLNIIAGQNLNGEGIGAVAFPPFYGFASTVGSLNTREPYSQAYAAVSWAWDQGAGYAEFGDTYYGNNNSFNERPFAIAHAGIRVPIAPLLSLQISGENIFNSLSGVFPVYGGGIPIPLANAKGCPSAAIGYGCGSAATLGNVFGPAVYTFMLTKRLNTP
jgi:outer membrane receptor protein involved in Fe transport